MSTFQPPLPDLVSSHMSIPPPPQLPTVAPSQQTQLPTQTHTDHTSAMMFQKQQVSSQNHEGNNCPANSPMMHTMLPSDESVVQMMMDCSVDANQHAPRGHNADCSSGIQSVIWTPSSSSSSTTTFNEYTPPYQQCLYPPPPSPPQIHAPRQQVSHQLPDMVPSKVVEELEEIMSNENDEVVFKNSIILLFRFSIDSVRGEELCRLMSSSPIIMNRLYYVLGEQFSGDDFVVCCATFNLTNLSKCDEGRAALLDCIGNRYSYEPSDGVRSLIRSLQSRDSNVVIFAITAIHNLLLDRRVELQEIAKEQIKVGLDCIVRLLNNQRLIHNYEFKVIVLDCLQILAYGNRENRLAIKNSGGPELLIRTIRENFTYNQPTEELIETASRVLKSLSACPANKIDIIEHGGISVLTHCIKLNNQEILKTCLWTLRNLSDVINNSSKAVDGHCINQLVERLLHILNEYADEPCIITCALGILANLTCNNEAIKQFICEHNGIDLLLNTINIACDDFRVVDKEIIEPAVCALCHLMNQPHDVHVSDDAKKNVCTLLNTIKYSKSNDLIKAVEKLFHLTFTTN